ncbi:MAG: hypothetical protein IPK82_26300 [Polyangiaceae bacterium]|nr:hypothetical protein [Polyangiaceae bacterium]
MSVQSSDGCPSEAWFRDQLAPLGLRGAVAATLGRNQSGEGYRAEIEARSEKGNIVNRTLTGASCSTVAEGLIVVAQVHLINGAPPVNSKPVLQSTTGVPTAARVTPAVAPTPFQLAVGGLFYTDSQSSGDAAFGGAAALSIALGNYPMRGFSLSGVYTRADIQRTVNLTTEHLRAKVEVVPWDLPISRAFALGLGVWFTAGGLRVAAQIDASTPGTRPFFNLGVGPRAALVVGPVSFTAGVDVSLALTQRNFEVTGLPSPLFSIPPFGVAASLGVATAFYRRRP